MEVSEVIKGRDTDSVISKALFLLMKVNEINELEE